MNFSEDGAGTIQDKFVWEQRRGQAAVMHKSAVAPIQIDCCIGGSALIYINCTNARLSRIQSPHTSNQTLGSVQTSCWPILERGQPDASSNSANPLIVNGLQLHSGADMMSCWHVGQWQLPVWKRGQRASQPSSPEHNVPPGATGAAILSLLAKRFSQHASGLHWPALFNVRPGRATERGPPPFLPPLCKCSEWLGTLGGSPSHSVSPGRHCRPSSKALLMTQQ
eukprot:1156275-Pelagomonas_calceolata.AAC.3